MDEAVALYDNRFWNEEEGLACDTWNTEFTELDGYRGLNANMHTVEAFLAASDVTGDPKYRVRAGRIIDRVLEWAKGNDWRIPEHYNSDWQADLMCNIDKPDDPFKPFGATPGHGIEWARLITQWALSTFGGQCAAGENRQGVGAPAGDCPLEKAARYRAQKAAEKYLDVAEHLFGRAIGDAWNADGAPGIVYTTDWEGKPVVHDRMHWTLAEAINTSAVLYHVTGNESYAALYEEFMRYLDTKVMDHVNGSWFHQLDRENRLLNTVWPGKSDLYHALQAMLIPYYAADLSIAPAVKQGKKIE